jgi:copper resistance protein D
METIFLVATRAVHFGACLLFFGILAFDRFVAASILAGVKIEAANYWKTRRRWVICALLPVILLSGIAWFASVAATMSALPLRQAVQPGILETVWNQTEFGTIWKLRLIVCLVAVAAAGFFCSHLRPRLQRTLVWIQLVLGSLLLGSLAWAGHGVEGPSWHLLADVLHLLVAGLWPTGLLPLTLFLHQLRCGSEPERWSWIAVLVRRFSALSLAAVALLAVTGFVNSWVLVGSLSNLGGQIYGRWLIAKICLFCFAVVIGAVNLLRLKPRLLAGNPPPPEAEVVAAQLQFNVQMELTLGTGMVVIVAILGILPPAIH